jgi:3-phenylpropionate/trans-cinnamate dioxygenase ferredoxin reductase subunit
VRCGGGGRGCAAGGAPRPGAGLSVTDGIDVDAFLRTSDPEIYAAGDVASVEHARYGRLRVEHWDNARRQGQATAAAMLDRAEPFDAIPYFFSDQYELGMEYTGRAAADDQLVIRGDVSSCEFIAFWLREGRVTAGMNVNVWDVADGIQALISDDVPVVVDRLADPGVALTDVVAARR